VAGNNRRTSKGSRVRPARAPRVEPRAAGRLLRMEELEDRTAPAIIQQGIPNWLPAGPAPAINGAVTGIPESPATGAVEALAPHPTNPNILFAGAVNGGVWRTFNALSPNPTWTPLTDQMPSLSIGDIDLNPQNPNQLIIGTGATSSAASISGDLIGVMYTENALAPTPAFQVFGGILANQTIRSVLARNGYLLAAGDGGLFRSTNRGAAWVQLDGSPTLPAGALYDAVADPGNPNRVYVAGPNGVFRTDNITAPAPQWINVTDPTMGLNPAAINPSFFNVKLAIHNSPGNNVVYVGVADQGPNGAAALVKVFWSANGGATWNEMDEAITLAAALTVTDATNASPIQITIGGVIDHGINTGDRVLVQGVQGNLGANGVWTATRSSATAITLDGSVGTGVYTGGGFVREIFGVAPGGQTSIHFAIAADPVNPNLVYLAGDRQESPFPTSAGASSFTANVLRGDRSVLPTFNTVAPSPQWTPITNNFAADNGAPYPDTRHLRFDAQNNLLQADDGGVYRRVDPRSDDGNWQSVIGNLSLGQFYQVRLDTLNNVIFGGTQDTSSIEQLDGSGPAGNTVWNTVLGGDGFWQGVDNTGKEVFGHTFRYMMANTIERFVRREYDADNKLVSVTPVLMASPTNPGKPFDGLDGSDKGSFGLNVFTLNAIDGRLMMLGVNKLYEDNDPDPALGKAGDVIANVTPQGFKGQVTSIVYGGRFNGIPVTRVAWVGTNAGQLWHRGAAGGFIEITNLPGSGPVNSVVADPDDFRTAYVLRNNSQVFRTNDAGATWVEITENLAATGFDDTGNAVGGLSTELHVLALWDPNPGTTAGEEILLAAGRGGVFRYVPSVADPTVFGGNWLEYGAGLPNAIVHDLQVYGNTVIVGTQGRGAWRIQDVSPTIAARAVVRVIGSDGDDQMSLVADASNPAFVIVSDGQGNTLRVERTVVQEFEFFGKGGADTLLIRANGLPGGDLSFIRYPITIDMGGNPGDTLIFENAGKSTPTRVTVTANTVGGGPTDNIFSSLGKVTYSGLQNGTLRIDLGPDLVDGNSVLVKSTSAKATELIGTPGYDAFQINSNAGIDLTGTLAGIGGAVVVNGRTPGGIDQLFVSDYGAKSGNSNVVIGKGVITGFAGPTDAAPIFYANIPDLRVLGSNNPLLAEQFTVQNPSSPLTLQALGGPDNINIRANTLPVAVHGGTGNDIIRISSLAGVTDDGDLSGIAGPVAVDGGPGDNRLIVSNFNSPVGGVVGVSATEISGVTPFPIVYQAVGGRFFASTGDGILIRGSNNGGDSFFLSSTLAGSQTAVDGLGGNDSFQVDGESLAGDVWLIGGAGNDSFGLTAGVFGITSDSLRISGGAGQDTTVFSGFEIDETVSVTLTNAATAQVAGLGNPFVVDTVESLIYDGQTGRNNLTFTNATGRGFGSVADPGSGIVFSSTGATSGTIAVARGTVGPVVSFVNVNGSDAKGVVVQGDTTPGQPRDVLTVVGTSDFGLQSPLGEPTAADGTDDIFVSDTGVVMRNNSLGFLRSVAVGRDAAGRPTLGALVVFAGNEANFGDTVRVLPSADLNIFVDGGLPTRRATGDKLEIATTAPRTVVAVNDPALGPPHSRVVFDNGASFGFTGFENAGGGTRQIFAVGADAGGGPRVQVFDAATRAILFDGFVYDPSFRGGVRVAVGDVTGDGIPDLITAAGIGGGPHIQVFDGTDFSLVAGFFAYEPEFTAGVYLAVGDVTGDGVAEIVTGTGFGGGPLVRVFNQFGIDLGAFFPYDENFRGGVRVAVGDVTGDGIGEIITAPGAGGGPHVRVFEFPTLNPVDEFFALDGDYRGGLYVAAGDMDADGRAEIAVGPSVFETPQIRIRRSNGEFVSLSVFDIGPIASPGPLPAVDPGVLTAVGSPTKQDVGIRLAMIDDADSGRSQVLAARGPGFPARVHAYTIDPFRETFNVVALDGAFDGGIFVG
jgi:hypothetical protein